MKPNNFDKDIQQKFNSRKIEPSAQAWDRLDAMLTVAEEKKQPKRFIWLSIAATFLVFTGIGYVFFQQNQKPEISLPQNEVVTTPESPKNEVENENATEFSVTPNIENELVATTSQSNKAVVKKVTNQENRNLKSNPIEAKQNMLLAQNENKNTNQDVVNEVPKQVENKKPTYNYVTPETLLADAQGQKNNSKNINTYKPTIKVNSEDLLYSAETELNQTFKEKALTKFKQAKSAFVNRNYN